MAENRLVTQGEIELRREVDALRAEVSALRQRIDSGGRLGPVPETLEQEAERTKRVADAIAAAMARDVRKDPPPPVDRTKLCTTDGRSPEEARASQTNETGQHASYIVLCDEERQKGFVRPYRDRYQHVGPLVCGAVPIGHEYPRCVLPPGHAGGHNGGGSVWMGGVSDPVRRSQSINDRPGMRFVERVGGCGAVTTMGRALSETYARDPAFYGATFCCTCNAHYPVAEFVWTADGQQVGS
jgi:hypothetical protein